jgi:hypothetical protein
MRNQYRAWGALHDDDDVMEADPMPIDPERRRAASKRPASPRRTLDRWPGRSRVIDITASVS